MDNYWNAGAGGMFAIISGAAVTIILVLGLWKMFKKAGEPGWAAIVPIYNAYVLFKITWGKGIKFLLTLIPIYNIYIIIKTQLKLAKSFGKGGGFAAGLIFLALIFYAILGFSDAEYLGVPAE